MKKRFARRMTWLARGGAILLLCCTALLACAAPSPSGGTPAVSPEARTTPTALPPTARPTAEPATPAPQPTARPTAEPATPAPQPTSTAATTTVVAQPGVTIRADGTLLVDGEPFFPFGFALYPRYQTEEFTPETLARIAASGFNTLHAPIRDNYPDLQADAARLGIRLIAEIYPYELDDSGIVQAIAWVKDHPALLAYAIADDVDDGEYYSPANVAQINELVKRVDRNHPTYISGFVPEQIGDFMQSADIVAMQSYPIGKTYWRLALPSHVNYALSTAMAAARPYNRPIIANLQAFAWPDQREPTAVEIRNMTYQALLNNVRGIVYYAYNDSVWRLEEHPTVWQALQDLTPEIERLAPVLLDGAYTRLDTGSDEIVAAQWRYADRLYVAVANAREQPVSVTIPLASPATGPIEPLFRERPAGLSLENGKLTGSMEALEVHVYVLNAGP